MELKKADQILKEAAELYQKKGQEYGNSYEQFGTILMSLFPKGIEIKTVQEANRMGIFFMMVHKMARIANTRFNSIDSLEDLGVYSAILEEIVLNNK